MNTRSLQVAKDLPSNLRKIDELLSTDLSGDELAAEAAADEALVLMNAMKDSDLVKAFGAGRQVPKRLYTLEELRLNAVRLLRP